MTAAVASLALVAIALPHLLRLDRVRPATAVTLWVAALTLRALIAVSLALYLLFVFPDTAAFKLLTHWCEHALLPLVGHVDVQGHTVGGVLALVPVVGALGGLLFAMTRIARAGRSVTRMLERSALGMGPAGSVIVGGPNIAVASAGFLRPRVVVTAGALAALEDDELAAGLAHEHGHIARRHHVLLVYGECCRALTRYLPGTRRAVSEFRFQLERDADEWALRRHHDPCALASAICKAATYSRAPTPVALDGGGAVERRLDVLMAPPRPRVGVWRRRVVDTAAVLTACVTLSSTVALPAEALASRSGHVPAHAEHHCGS